MTLLRNCFIGADRPVGKDASQASELVLKKRLAVPPPLAPTPAISGLTAPQGFVFSLFPVPALGGPGVAFRRLCEALRRGRKAITDQSVAGPPVFRNSPEGKMPAGFLRISEKTRRPASRDVGCAD